MQKEFKSLRALMKSTGTRKPEVAVNHLLRKLGERHPDYTAVAVFKAGPLDHALIMPIGPSCGLHSLEEAAGATVGDGRKLAGYWKKQE